MGISSGFSFSGKYFSELSRVNLCFGFHHVYSNPINYKRLSDRLKDNSHKDDKSEVNKLECSYCPCIHIEDWSPNKDCG